MFENTLSPARPFNIVGTEDAQGVFIINDGFVQSLGGILSTRMEPLTEEELAGDTISKSESSKSSN